MFDSSISLGNILTIGMFLVAVTVYIVSNSNSAKVLDVRLSFIDAQMEDFKLEMKKLADIIITQVAQSSRMDRLSDTLMATGKRLDDTTNGLGKRIDTIQEQINHLQDSVRPRTS